jgi:N-methylhydantoinase A
MANANMERAMRLVSVERGRDPRQYALIGFGGAGPLHAVRLAMALGIPKVVIPKGAGVGSALGLLEAESRLDYSLTRIVRLVSESWESVVHIYRELEARARADIARVSNDREVSFSRYAYMRYSGQGHEIRVDVPNLADRGTFFAQLHQRFADAYRRAYGYDEDGRNIEGVDWYLAVSVPNASSGTGNNARPVAKVNVGSSLRSYRPAYFPELGGFRECAVYDRYALAAGETILGPAIVEERESTTVIPPGNTAAVSEAGNLIVTLNGAAGHA